MLHQRGGGADHGGEVEEGDRAELSIPLFIDAARIVEEAFIARDIFGIEPGDLGAEGGFVVGIVEIGAVAPIEPVEGGDGDEADILRHVRSEEHTSELQSLMRISYAVSCLKHKTNY